MTRVDVIKAMAKANYEFENGFGSWDLVSENSQVKLCRFMSSALSALESLGIALVPVKVLKPINFLAGLNEQDPDSKSVFVALGVLRQARDAADALSASPLRKTEEA